MGIKSNVEKNMDKATTKYGAQIAMKGGNPFTYDQLLKEKSNKKEHPGKTCKQSHPGKTHKEWADISVEGEMEEATDSSSAGAYVGPLGYAKDEKNWRGKSKTQWPGGKFVKIKKRCSTFPYCNQGDINALQLTDSLLKKKIMKEAVSNVSKKTGKKKEDIEQIIKKEIEEIIRRSFYKSPITSLVGTAKMDTPIGKIFTMNPKGVSNKYE